MIDNINIRGPILICFQPGIDILRSTAKYGLFGTGLVLGLSVSRVVWLLERGVTHVTTNVRLQSRAHQRTFITPLFRHFTPDPPSWFSRPPTHIPITALALRSPISSGIPHLKHPCLCHFPFPATRAYRQVCCIRGFDFVLLWFPWIDQRLQSTMVVGNWRRNY